MQVIEHLLSGVVILEPQDAITADTEYDLKDAVRRQLDAGRVHVVLDLQHVPHIDSCGLGRMVQAYVSAQRLGGSLKLMNVKERNRQTLAVTRLSSVLEILQPTELPVNVEL